MVCLDGLGAAGLVASDVPEAAEGCCDFADAPGSVRAAWTLIPDDSRAPVPCAGQEPEQAQHKDKQERRYGHRNHARTVGSGIPTQR